MSYFKSESSEPLSVLTMNQVLDECFIHYGHQIAISFYGGRKLTYSEVLNEANQLASAFVELGLQRGDHLAIWGFNSVEWYLTYLGAIKAGLVIVNINPLYEGPELKSCLLNCDVKALVMDEKIGDRIFYDTLKNIVPEISEYGFSSFINSDVLPFLRIVVIISQRNYNGTFKWTDLMLFPKIDYKDILKKLQTKIDVFDVCDIQFTSGTTSEPKGVMLTHYNLVNNAFIVGKYLGYSKKHHISCVLVPFFHAYGKVIGITSCFCYGTTTILPSIKFSPSRTIDCIIAEKCTSVFGTPTMYSDLINILNDKLTKHEEITSKMSSVEIFWTGGATCLPGLMQKMKKILTNVKFKNAYGMTETSPATIMSLLDEPEDMVLSTIGHVIDHTEVKVVNENNDIVPYGSPGEMCFRGYMIMKGYYKNEKETKNVLEENGWFHSGDKFILYENGYAQIVGRFKETIIRGGENIEPREIEEVLVTHPDVVNAQVFGIADERLGEVVAASVIKNENSNVTEDDLKKYCGGIIASFKIPKYFLFLSNFPRTSSGKIQKFKLKNMMEHQLKLNSSK